MSEPGIVERLSVWMEVEILSRLTPKDGVGPVFKWIFKIPILYYKLGLGWMLENIEEWTQAEGTYKQFMKENPADPDASYPLANYYFMKKQYEKVPALLEPAIKMARKPHPNSFRRLAHAYERMEKVRLDPEARMLAEYKELQGPFYCRQIGFIAVRGQLHPIGQP